MSQLPSQVGQPAGMQFPSQPVSAPPPPPQQSYQPPAPQPPAQQYQTAPVQPPPQQQQQQQQQPPAGSEPLWDARAIQALMQGREPTPSIHEELAKRGLPVDQVDDSTAMDYLVQRAQQAQQYEQALAAQQYQLAQLQAQQQQAQQQSQPQNGPGPQQPESYWDKGPEWDPQWEQYLTPGEDGNVKLSPSAIGVVDPTLPQKYLARKRWEREAAQKLLTDPAAVVWKGIQDPVMQLVDKVIEHRLQQQREQEFAAAFTADNDHWLYDHDQSGQRVMNPATGKGKLSQVGEVFAALVAQQHKTGVRDSATAAHWAMMALPGALAQLGINVGQPQPDQQQYQQQYPQAAPPTPQGFSDFGRMQQNEQFLRANEMAALHSPGRGGSLAASQLPGGPVQNSEIDPKAMMTQLAHQLGLM